MSDTPRVLDDERLALIFRRRSVRKFLPEPVSEYDIEALLQAAMAAPSASNRRPWEFVVVTDEGQLARLRRGLVFGRYDAPLAVGGVRQYPAGLSPTFARFLDRGLQRGHGEYAVGIHGIGTRGCVGWRLSGQAVHAGRRAGVLGLPRHIIPLGVAYIGHPAEERRPRTQYDAQWVHRDHLGQVDEGQDDDVVEAPGESPADRTRE